jgi:hypothetical protein
VIESPGPAPVLAPFCLVLTSHHLVYASLFAIVLESSWPLH